MVIDASLFNSQHYKVWIKGQLSNPGKEVAPSPTPWCRTFEKQAFGSSLTTVGLLTFKSMLAAHDDNASNINSTIIFMIIMLVRRKLLYK